MRMRWYSAHEAVAYFGFRVKITYAELSSTGPVRPHNEDFVTFWEPEGEQPRGLLRALTAAELAES